MVGNDEKSYLVTADDGVARCWWGCDPLDYRSYHDDEWGLPETDDYRLFEKICLEGFQSGLSWLTVLRKRENFRAAFLGFDFYKVSKFNESDIARLLSDKGIIRHRGKIEATINNASRAIDLVEEFGSVAKYVWTWEPSARESQLGGGSNEFPMPSITATSQALSKDLKKRGWKFFGPTTAYAFMQAMGLVNDHVDGCASQKVVAAARARARLPK